MFLHAYSPARRLLLAAFAASLLIHTLVLLIPRLDPPEASSPPRVEARLRKPSPTETATPPKARTTRSASRQVKPRLLTTDKPGKTSVASAPWSAADKAEMNNFLDELDSRAKATPRPTLAQRSLAMAREEAWRQAREESSGSATLDLRPNAAPPDPFSLEMYLEGLLKRLNRSAAFVKNDVRATGMRPASIEFKLNPDGTMKSFRVVNAGDQDDEIAFVKAVVERSAPFSPFPVDIDKAARGLTMRICILPKGSGEGGFGFTRAGSRAC